MRTAYDLLGIRPDADAETVKKAFREAAKLNHPDYRPGDRDAARRFRQIVTANTILRDPRRRAAYDRLVARTRQRIRAERTRMIVSETIYIAVLSIVLLIGLLWIKIDWDKPRAPTQMAAVRPTAQADAVNRAALGDKLEVIPERAIEPSLVAPAADATGVQVAAQAGPDIGLRPNDAEFYRERGIAAYRNGDFHQAIADLDQAIRLDPIDAKAYNVRANAWDYAGASDRALADYDEAIRLDPNNPAVFHDRGMMWRRKGELDRALVDMDRAIRFGFSDASFYSDRGLIWFEKGRHNRAIADFDRAGKINPNFVGAYINHGVALHRESDFAFADVDRAIHMDPNMSP
jgi:curved DNA-binding protein CbpA